MRAFQEHQNRGDDAVQNSRQKNDLLDLQGNSKNIQQYEDAHTRYSSYYRDKEGNKAIPQIRFSHPLHDMQEIEYEQQDESQNCVDQKDHDFFCQIVDDGNDCYNEKN
jgi:hypothetical protein